MTKRKKLKLIPGNGNVETRAISDKGKLAWERFYGPVHQAQLALAALVQGEAGRLIETEGLNVGKGWRMNLDTMELFRSGA